MTALPIPLRRADARARWQPAWTLKCPDRWDLLQAAKTAAAAAAAWALCRALLDTPMPVFAALAAIISVQATVVDSLSQSAQQLAGVLTGVTIASLVTSSAGNGWAAVGALVLTTLLVGQVLPLGRRGAAQVPSSALMLLTAAAGLQGHFAFVRIADTVVGAAVGVVVNVLVAPPVYLTPASRAVREVSGKLAEQLASAGRTSAQPSRVKDYEKALVSARSLEQRVRAAEQTVSRARLSLRWNPRALLLSVRGHDLRQDGEQLAAAAKSLRHVSAQTRTVCRVLRDEAIRCETRSGSADGRISPVLPPEFQELLACVARALVAFGTCVDLDRGASFELVDAGARREAAGELILAVEAARRAGNACAAASAGGLGRGAVGPGLFDPGATGGVWWFQASLLSALARTVEEVASGAVSDAAGAVGVPASTLTPSGP